MSFFTSANSLHRGFNLILGYIASVVIRTQSLYAANTNTPVLTFFSVAADDSVTSVGNYTAQNVDNLAICPNGKFVFGTNSTLGNIVSFSRNAANSVLNPITSTAYNLAYGIAVSFDSLIMFVSAKAGGANVNILSYSINQSTGALGLVSNQATLHGNPLQITAHPTKRFLYSAMLGANVIELFTFTVGGALSAGTTYASDASPAHFCISPDGLFGYSANGGAATIGTYSIDQNTGALTLIDTHNSQYATPVFSCISPDGLFLYMCHAPNSNISIYSRDLVTGILSDAGNFVFASAYAQIAIAYDGLAAYTTGPATLRKFDRNITSGALSNPATIGSASQGLVLSNG